MHDQSQFQKTVVKRQFYCMHLNLYFHLVVWYSVVVKANFLLDVLAVELSIMGCWTVHCAYKASFSVP